MIFFVAGYHAHLYELCVKHNVHKLWSVIYELRYIERHDPAIGPWLMIDSGAHSWNRIAHSGGKPAQNLPPVREHLEWYIDFVNKDERPDIMFVELDCFEHFTLKELDEIYERYPRDKTMRVYHPKYDDGSLEAVDAWIAQGFKYFGVGNDSTPLLDAIFARTRDKIKVHGFGMTKRSLVERYPFYSVDSTNVLATAKFGHGVIRTKGTTDDSFLMDKEQAFKVGVHGVCKDRVDRLEDAILEFQRLMRYYTALWTARGIEWPESPWKE